ncbi:MAG: mannitol dehydrogenase family protein [Pseudomonadota bacterium]
MAISLSLAQLDRLPDGVERPGYDRADLSPGILHIGIGNFHRAHQAVYLDRLFSMGRDHDWAVIGAGVKPFDAARRRVLMEQDWLTTVVELDPEQLTAQVTGAMIDFCEVSSQALIERLSDPAIRIVSLTITEGGYYMDPDGGFDTKNIEIQEDARRPDDPQTVFGILLAGLRRRRDLGHAPFTVLSCDNLPENGHVTRRTLEGLSGLIDPALRDWVHDHVACPNCMVDCIAPAITDSERDLVAERFDIADAAPVTCEPFRQWVMEDNFPLGRPALEHVGVEFVQDVAPYETMKLRILNAGHAAIAYPAALLGYHYVHDAMADAQIRVWLSQLMRREVIPVLPKIDGVDFGSYLDMCVSRFSNPVINDTVARLCLDGSNRQPKFVLPTVMDALALDQPVDGLALEVAFWCRYCAASADPASGIALADERAERLAEAALATRQDGVSFLHLREVFGSLAEEPRFVAVFKKHAMSLWSGSTRDALAKFADVAQNEA